jgi:hypothetical protein
VAEGIYLYFHVMSLAFGGKGLPLGKPLPHSAGAVCLRRLFNRGSGSVQ